MPTAVTSSEMTTAAMAVVSTGDMCMYTLQATAPILLSGYVQDAKHNADASTPGNSRFPIAAGSARQDQSVDEPSRSTEYPAHTATARPSPIGSVPISRPAKDTMQIPTMDTTSPA